MNSADYKKARQLSALLAGVKPAGNRRPVISPIQPKVQKVYMGRPGEKGDKGDKGDKPIAGVDYPIPKNGKDGRDGVSPDMESIVAKVLERMAEHVPKDGQDGKDVDEESVVARLIERIQNERILDISHIRNYEQFVYGGTKYKVSELMHGGGNTTASASIITIVGTINDSNVTFTAATKPSILVINGAQYIQTGGAITWTYSAGTITLSSPVGTGGSIFGIS